MIIARGQKVINKNEIMIQCSNLIVFSTFALISAAALATDHYRRGSYNFLLAGLPRFPPEGYGS